MEVSSGGGSSRRAPRCDAAAPAWRPADPRVGDSSRRPARCNSRLGLLSVLAAFHAARRPPCSRVSGSLRRPARCGSRPALLPVFALVCAAVGAAVGVETVSQEDGEPDVHAIVVEAVERMDEALQAVAGDYRALVTSESREFDGRGEVEEETRVEWESVPIDGARFSRRIAIDGRPLTEEERARESEREAAFRERLRRLRAGEIEPERNENQIIFDEELVARYDMTLEGEEPFRNRPSYRIAFTPRAGDLPVRRQIERALNKARGRVWVDRETHEIARLEFELIDRVRLWWGLVGTIHRFRGSLDRGPVLDGRWANLQSESYSDVRVFFSRSRQASLQRWRDYAWIEDPPPPDAPDSASAEQASTVADSASAEQASTAADSATVEEGAR